MFSQVLGKCRIFTGVQILAVFMECIQGDLNGLQIIEHQHDIALTA